MRVHVNLCPVQAHLNVKFVPKFECMFMLKIVLVSGLCLRYFPVLAREKKSLEFELEFELKIELDFELVFKRQIVIFVV